MKASTLFVVSIALFVGLAAFAGAKYFGLFAAKAPEVQVKEEPKMVLVAKVDMYPEIAISSNDVQLREVTKDEADFYNREQTYLMPPSTAAANMRIPNKKINAGTVLRRDHFKEGLPEALTLRLNPGMRAALVMVPKERAASGIIQLGEYLDVWLTAKIPLPDGRTDIKTAQIAHECRLISKRASLYIVPAADPPGQPIPWVLETNPYRAALLEYAQHKGEITLTPVYKENPQILVTSRNSDQMMTPMSMPTYSVMNSHEYRDEDSRVQKILMGDYQVGDADFARIFQIQPPYRPDIISVQILNGISPAGVKQFLKEGGAYNPVTGAPTGGVNAGPQDKDKEERDCPTCPKKDTSLKDPNTFPTPPGKSMPTGPAPK